MKISGSSYFFIIIMLAMLPVISLSLAMEEIKLKLLPLIIGSAVFFLAAIELIKEILAAEKQKESIARDKIDKKEEDRKDRLGYLHIGAWVTGFFLAIYLLGFIIAIPVFVFTYMKSHRIGWLVAITSTAITTAVIYVVFEFALEVDLYPGLFL